MSYRKSEKGFSLVELMMVIALIGIVGIGIYTFTVSSMTEYLKLHADGLRFSDLNDKTQRVSRVLRGAGDITEAGDDAITTYAYFSPADQYYSLIRYYVSDDKKQLMADVTLMSANPPIGTPIAGSKKTYVILDNFYRDPSLATFQYLDSAGNIYSTPIADLHTIKGIRINMAVANNNASQTTKTAMSVQVSLRNRKTNL